MNKRLIKILSLVISSVFLFSFFGCKKKTPNGDNLKLKEGTVKILFYLTGEPKDYRFVLNEINSKLEEDGKPYNVEFIYKDEGDYTTQIGLLANDGYDLAFVHYDHFSDFMNSGVLLDAKPYLEKYGQELLSSTPNYAWKAATKDGGIYTIPRNMPISDTSVISAARKDWLDEFDMSGITTLAELDSYFANVNNKFEQEYIDKEFSSERKVYDADDHFSFLLREYCPSFYFPISDYAVKPLYIDLDEDAKENGKYVVKNYFESDEFLSFINKTRSYYNQGYILPNQVNNSENYFINSYVGICWSSLFKTTERIDKFLESNKDTNPDAEIYDLYLYPNETSYIVEGYENSMGLLAGSEMPAEAVDFLNWVRSSQENHDLVCYGIKGRNYNLTDDGKLDFAGIDSSLRYADKNPYWSFNDIRYTRYSKSLSNEYISKLKNWDNRENVVVSPLAGFALDTSSVVVKTSLANVKASASACTDLVDGRVDPMEVVGGKTRIQKLRDDVKAGGIDTLIAEVQKQVDAFLGQ